jgi:hypothetical protein
MKRMIINTLLILSIFICVLSIIHIVVDSGLHREERTLFVESLCASAKGVSANLLELFARNDETFDASVSGVKVYMNLLVDEFKGAEYYSYSYRSNILLWKSSFLSGINLGHITMLHVRDRVEAILDRLIEGTPEGADYEYLNKLKYSLDLLLGSLQNEDGEINKKSLNRDYITERINEFLEAIS